MTDVAVAGGVRELAAHDLSFDACTAHDELPALTVLATSCPDTTVVLAHEVLGPERCLSAATLSSDTNQEER